MLVSSSFALYRSIRFGEYVKHLLRQRFLLHKKPAVNELDIRVVETELECDYFVEELRRRITNYRILGMDCEWVTRDSRRPVALLQLGTSDGYCVLIRLSKIGSIPFSLKALLSDPMILKVGFSLLVDVRNVLDDYNVAVESWVDVKQVAIYHAHLNNYSLKELTKSTLGIDLLKTPSITCSDWEKRVLSYTQKCYAAKDAFIPVKILEYFLEQKLSFKDLVFLRTHELFRRVLNMLHDKEYINSKDKIYSNVRSRPGNKVADVAKRKQVLSLKYENYYQNYYLLSPDDRVLCTCSEKKINWYLCRGLAEFVPENDKAIRLKFTPGASKGCTNIQIHPYWTTEKENRCVVCGTESSLSKKYIVPSEYRRHLPIRMKSHNDQDILLHCLSCHYEASLIDRDMRKYLAALCSAPLDGIGREQVPESFKTMRSFAKSLLRARDRLPLHRVEYMEYEIFAVYQKPVTQELLEEILDTSLPKREDGFKSHGELVVKYFEEHHSVEEFVSMWRNNYIQKMRPSHLPKYWSTQNFGHQLF